MQVPVALMTAAGELDAGEELDPAAEAGQAVKDHGDVAEENHAVHVVA